MEATSTDIINSAFEWAPNNFVEVMTIATGIVALSFGTKEWFFPRIVKLFLSWFSTWPVKCRVLSAHIDGPARRVEWEYEIRPRVFTVTERHNPRLYGIRVSIAGSAGTWTSELFTPSGLPGQLDEIWGPVTFGMGIAEGGMVKYGEPHTLTLIANAGYRHSRRVEIESPAFWIGRQRGFLERRLRLGPELYPLLASVTRGLTSVVSSTINLIGRLYRFR